MAAQRAGRARAALLALKPEAQHVLRNVDRFWLANALAATYYYNDEIDEAIIESSTPRLVEPLRLRTCEAVCQARRRSPLRLRVASLHAPARPAPPRLTRSAVRSDKSHARGAHDAKILI